MEDNPPITKEEIRKNITIIALNNLIDDYSRFLETCENNQERELAKNIVDEATDMLSEYTSQIKRPQWKKDHSHR